MKDFPLYYVHILAACHVIGMNINWNGFFFFLSWVCSQVIKSNFVALMFSYFLEGCVCDQFCVLHCNRYFSVVCVYKFALF